MKSKHSLELLAVLWLILGLVGCQGGALPSAPAPATTQAPEAPAAETVPPTEYLTPEISPTPNEVPTVLSETPTMPSETPTTPNEVPTAPVASLAPTLPAPPPEPVPGIELHRMDEASVDLVAQAKGYWVRRNALLWSDVEPEEGLRNWGALAGLEQEIQTLARQGLGLVLIVRGAPAWAQQKPGYRCGPVSSDKLNAFAHFMYDLVQRYSPPPYNVKYWELWNEPDIDSSLVSPDSEYGCWGDQADMFYGGGYYAEMLSQVYPQIKAADPEAQVLVGGQLLDCDPVNPPEGRDCAASLFFEGILRSGGGEYFDGVSFHAYDYYTGPGKYSNGNWNSGWDSTGPVLIAKARYLRSLLASYQQPGKFLMNTESGLLCGRTGDEPECQADDYGLTKASYAAQANVAALVEGLRGNIWYSLSGWRGTGLVDSQMKPNPAYRAYQFGAAELLGAAPVRTVNEIPGVRGYELLRGETRLLILWSADGEVHPYSFDQAPRAVYNLFGETTQPTNEIRIGPQPVYLEW